MKRHTVVGMARKPLSLYHLEPHQRKVTNKKAFRINEGVISQIQNEISREILNKIFIQKVPQTQVISDLSKQKGVRVVEAKDLCSQAMEEARELALKSPSNIVKGSHRPRVLAFNWENPKPHQVRRFERTFEEAFDKKFDQHERGQRILSAYKRGEEISRIAGSEGLSVPTTNTMLYKLLKKHPELKAQRKTIKKEITKATKKYFAKLPSPKKQASVKVVQNKERKPRKIQKGTGVRNRKARVLLEERRHERIIRNYKNGMDLTNLVPGYRTTPASAYQYARRMARDDASIDSARKEALGGNNQSVSNKPTNISTTPKQMFVPVEKNKMG